MINSKLQYVALISTCLIYLGSATKSLAGTYATLPYTGFIDNNDASIAPDQTLTGIYNYLGSTKHSFELDFAKMDAEPISTGLAKSTQLDYTAVYSNTQMLDYKLSLGGHFIDNGDYGDTKVYFLGLNHDQLSLWLYKKWSLDGAYTYSDYTRENNNYAVNQLKVGFHKYWAIGVTGAYADTYSNAYLISANNRDNDITDTYIQGQLGANFYLRKYTLGAYAGLGESAFAVENDGFLVRNDNVIISNNMGLTSSYQITPRFSLRLDIQSYKTERLVTRIQGAANKAVFFLNLNF